MAGDTENLAWAEFSETLRLPIDPERDYTATIPWKDAGFKAELPLLDIGSGSGVTTLELADRFADTEVISVEPDPVMRSLLMLRVAERPDIRSRTTVLAESILDCWLPEQCGGALLFNVIYFLGGRTRDAFWERMAKVMVPGAPILMSRQYGGVPEALVERELRRTATMGRHEYQRWFEAKPVRDGRGDTRMEITNTFVVLRDGEKVREVTSTITPWGLDEDTVVEEIPIGKFSIEEINDRYLAIRRQPDLKR